MPHSTRFVRSKRIADDCPDHYGFIAFAAGCSQHGPPYLMEGNVTMEVSLKGAVPQGAESNWSVVGIIEIEQPNDILVVGRC